MRGTYFAALVCLVHCGKTADRIRMPFGVIGRTGPGMRQVVGFGDRSMGRGTFGGEFGARSCNQWGLYGVRVRQWCDAALFPNYFGQTCLLSKAVCCSFLTLGLRVTYDTVCGYVRCAWKTGIYISTYRATAAMVFVVHSALSVHSWMCAVFSSRFLIIVYCVRYCVMSGAGPTLTCYWWARRSRCARDRQAR